MHWLTWIGLLLIGFGTAFTIIGQQRISEKNDQLLQNKSERVEKLSEENIRLSKEIAKLNEKIASTVTGGDSYSYFFFTGPNNSNECDLMLLTSGEYPLYDVSIRIDDVEHMLDLVKDEADKGNLPYNSITEVNENLYKYSKIMKVGNLGPNQALQLGLIKFSQDKKQSYNINITARNGNVVQFIRFRKKNGKWKRAERILFNGVVMKETIDPEFPLENEHEILW